MSSEAAPSNSRALGNPREAAGRLITPERLHNLWRAFRNLFAAPSLVFMLLFLLSLRTANLGIVYTAITMVLFALVYRFMPRSDYRLFVLYFIGFAVFNGLRTEVHQVGIPVGYEYPIEFDKALFGTVPTTWLQTNFFELGNLSAHDWIAVTIYTTYFWAHFVTAGVLWVIKRDLLKTYITLVLGVFFTGLAIYFLVPTSPPWLASETGHLPEVFRVGKLATSEVWAEAYSQGTYIAGTNDVAAMPSLHTALTAVIALIAWRVNRFLGILGWLYVGAMGLSLVYMGEHYVVDVLAGIALPCVLWRLMVQQAQVSSESPPLAQSETKPVAIGSAGDGRDAA